jgi:alpha-mannosidase II
VIQGGADKVLIALWNPTLVKRREIVSFYTSRHDVVVEGVDKFQVSPDVARRSSDAVDQLDVSRLFVVSFVAEADPLSVRTYLLKYGNGSRDSLASVTVHDGGVESTRDWTNELPPVFVRHRASDEESFSIASQRLKVTFDPKGDVTSVTLGQETVNVRLKYVLYGTRSSGEASGAYLFLPDGPAKDYVVRDPAPVVRVEGPLFSQVVVDAPLSRRVVTVSNSDGVDGFGFDVSNYVDIRSERDRELAMRFDSEVASNSGFYTDSNGYQVRFDGKMF